MTGKPLNNPVIIHPDKPLGDRMVHSTQLGDDGKMSRMIEALSGKPREPRKKKPITIRKF